MAMMPDDPTTPMFESAMAIKELYDTYLSVGFAEPAALYLAGVVAFAVSQAMYQAQVAEEGANQARAMLLQVAQDQANRLRQRTDPYAERVAQMKGIGLFPRQTVGGWMCPRCHNIVPYLSTDGPVTSSETPQAIIVECARDNHAARLANWPAHQSRWAIPPDWPGQQQEPVVPNPPTWPLELVKPIVCGICGLAVPMDVTDGFIPAIAALYAECTPDGHGHDHRFPGPKVSCVICGRTDLEDRDGMLVCPDHPAPPTNLGGM